MSSDLKKTILNTRERWTSSKYNTQIQMHDRNLQEALRHSTGSQSGVINGLQVAVSPGTMQCTVSAGLALLFDSSKVEPDSQYRWIELLTATAVTIPAADPVNPRWDVIEIAPGVASTGLFSRDIFNPALGTFTPVNVSIAEDPTPVLQVRSGTAAANPVLPAGTSGQIPLAYVYVPAAAVTLTVGDTIGCRPIARRPLADKGQVVGGGVNVAGTSSAGLIDPQKLSAILSGLPFEIGIDAMASLDINTASDESFVSGESFVNNEPGYAYVCTAPYPAGYTVAPREFVPGSNIGPGARIPSVPDPLASNTQNAILVFSTTAPTDPLDPISGDVDGAALNDAFWNSGTVVASVYLGAFTGSSGGNLIGQRYQGDGEMMFTPATLATIPNEFVDASSGGSSGTGDFRRENPITDAGDFIVPDTANAGFFAVSYDETGSPTSGSLQIDTLAAGSHPACIYLHMDNGSTPWAMENYDTTFWLYSETFDFDWDIQNGAAGTRRFTLTVHGYRDQILAAR